MSARRTFALFALASLLLGAFHAVTPAAEAQSTGPQHCEVLQARYSQCLEQLMRDPAVAGISHNMYRIAWRPIVNPYSGLYDALIVGGAPDPSGFGGRGVILLYDGVAISKLFESENYQIFDVAWAPDGSYALAVSGSKSILRLDPPILGKPGYVVKDLWADCARIAVQNCAETAFFGQRVAFNPAGGYAWITGSALLEYDGRNVTVVDSGNDIAWRSIAWRPDGTQALLSAVVCVNPGQPTLDAPCAGNVTANRLVPGRVILADVQQHKLCEAATYGKYDVQRAEVHDITWEPGGSWAFIYGSDDFHGTILRYDATATPGPEDARGCADRSRSFSWLASEKAGGEIEQISRRASTGRYWAANAAGEEVMEGNDTTFRVVFGEHDVTGGKGTIYYSLKWDPTDRYALIAGFGGRLYKYVPATRPLTRIMAPANDTLVAGDVVVGGKVFTVSAFDTVDKIEINITGAGGSTGWMPLPETGSVLTVHNWSYAWPASSLTPGVYLIQARAFSQGNESNLSNRTVHLVPPGSLEMPRLEELPPTSPSGSYVVRWSSANVGVQYELESAALPPPEAAGGAVSLSGDFAFSGDQRLIYRGPNSSFPIKVRNDGEYFYRVRAVTNTSVSPWSPTQWITVSLDSDGDGFSDAVENARGSDPRSATSTPDDWDGDGHANAQDAFPYDPAEWKDSDGDGIGDNRDKFPLDPREIADTDSDGWGDHSEVRLGSNPYDPKSTPETDDDGDGCLNKDEAAAKTDPRSPSSAPSWCALTLGPGGSRPVTVGGGKGLPGFEPAFAFALLGLAALATRRLRSPRSPRRRR